MWQCATGQEVCWEKKKLFKVREFNFEPGEVSGFWKMMSVPRNIITFKMLAGHNVLLTHFHGRSLLCRVITHFVKSLKTNCELMTHLFQTQTWQCPQSPSSCQARRSRSSLSSHQWRSLYVFKCWCHMWWTPASSMFILSRQMQGFLISWWTISTSSMTVCCFAFFNIPCNFLRVKAKQVV